ncbi:MAG: potassium-transporting ATPase subunit KdpA, partial [Parafilimonas sp.]
MNSEILGVIVTFLLTVLLAIPLGKYIAKVFSGERTLMDFMHPIERFIFRVCGIDPTKGMNWKEFLKAMLTINLVWFVYGFFMLVFQDKLPLNPDGNPGQTPDLAFNTIISFIVNCNLQHYSGETGLTYLTQTFVICFLQFVSAATGIACLVALFNAFKEKTTGNLGNFWSIFLKSTTRILLPLSLIVAVILAFNGTPTSYKGKDTIVTLQGDTQHISRGPAAGIIAIKQLGTNGGGYFGANSSVPFENPNYFTNIVEAWSITIISIALIFAMGYYINRKKLAWIIFGVMTCFYLLFVINNIYFETQGNPEITRLGIAQPTGAMEGKEVRIGAAATAYWSVA